MKKIFSLAAICLCVVVFLGCATTIQKGALIRARSGISDGKYEFALKRLSEAESYADTTPELKAEIIYLRAICYEGLGRHDDARGALKYLVDRLPDSSYAYQAKEKLRTIERKD
jgi:tetratricopeptide (TPR) repeat protein